MMQRRDFFKLTILAGAGTLLPRTATAQTCYARPAAGMARVSLFDGSGTDLLHVADYPVEYLDDMSVQIYLGDVCELVGVNNGRFGIMIEYGYNYSQSYSPFLEAGESIRLEFETERYMRQYAAGL
jgi:hypothetical protein